MLPINWPCQSMPYGKRHSETATGEHRSMEGRNGVHPLHIAANLSAGLYPSASRKWCMRLLAQATSQTSFDYKEAYLSSGTLTVDTCRMHVPGGSHKHTTC